jgi:hypothetical protein
MAWGIGQTFGPYIIAVIIDHSTYNVAFIVVALVLLLTALGFWKLPK